MPALAERTKIRTGSTNIPMTTGFTFFGGGSTDFASYGSSAGQQIDANVYMIGSGSTKVILQNYMPEPSIKAKDILRKIYQFKNLPDNWDDHGGTAPSDKVVNRAAFFVAMADESDLPIYFTAPGPNGEIVLDYKNGKNTAEIYFEDSNVSEMILYIGSDQQYVGEVSLKLLEAHLTPTVLIHGR